MYADVKDKAEKTFDEDYIAEIEYCEENSKSFKKQVTDVYEEVVKCVEKDKSKTNSLDKFPKQIDELKIKIEDLNRKAENCLSKNYENAVAACIESVSIK